MTMRSITWGVATLVLALIVHFSSVIAIPSLSENDAWRRLLAQTTHNQMQVIKDVAATNQLWAFHAPDTKFAICRFDLSNGPVRVDLQLLRGYWSVAIYDDESRNFYAADGYDLMRPAMSLMLLGPDHAQEADDALPISVPSYEGLVVIRAPLDSQLMEDTVIAVLEKATCTEIELAKNS